MSDNSTDQSEYQNIYTSMAPMSSNAEIHIRYFEYSLQLSNWIIDSGATCHIKSEMSYFILGSLVETDKYIEVADENFVTAEKQENFN